MSAFEKIAVDYRFTAFHSRRESAAGSKSPDWFVLKVKAAAQMLAVDWQRLTECRALANDFAVFSLVK